MKVEDAPRFHSVVLHEADCKGCTVCVTTCPAEAIRVRDGKASIIAEKCIDCGECIRRCPHHAKKERADDFSRFMDPNVEPEFDYRIALPAPSFYGQFPERYSIGDIHSALIHLGFDEVFPVAAATNDIAMATRRLLDRSTHPELPRPLISSSCPTIIKFIQIRFPTLLDHIVPVIAPMELAARLARQKAQRTLSTRGSGKDRRIGVFFISPCAGKITEAKEPSVSDTSSIDGVFSMRDIHLALLTALSRAAPHPPWTGTGTEIAWGRSGGEAEATVDTTDYVKLSVDGMDQCRRILESVEDGKAASIDFLELMACTGGCVGGPLTVENPSLAAHTLVLREKTQESASPPDHSHTSRTEPSENCLRQRAIPPRPALLLDSNYAKALRMMDSMDRIYQELPALDCGCCGAPNCHALAEDIVRGMARKTDCVIILKEQYRELLEK